MKLQTVSESVKKSIKSVKEDYGDGHPQIIQIKEYLDAAKKALTKAIDNVVEIEADNDVVKTLKEEVERIDADLYSLIEDKKLWNSLDKRMSEGMEVTGNAPEGVEEAGEQGALSVDQKPAQFNVTLKQTLKKLGVTARIRIINSYNWPKCWVQAYSRENEFPNELRKEVMLAMGRDPKEARDPEDINYGNIQTHGISAHAHEWVTALSKL